MKKVFFTIALMAAAFFCQAQLFVGGGLGFGTQSGSVKTGSVSVDAPKVFSFGIRPTVGYMFNENVGAGLAFGFSYDKTTDGDEKIKTPGWEVAPFFRYVVADWDAVSLYADLVVNINGNKIKYDYDGTTFDDAKTFGFGIGVVPGIAYHLTDNISINADVDLVALGYNMTKVTTPAESEFDEEVVTKTNTFGFGVNRPTSITVGFFYTF